MSPQGAVDRGVETKRGKKQRPKAFAVRVYRCSGTGPGRGDRVMKGTGTTSQSGNREPMKRHRVGIMDQDTLLVVTMCLGG